METKIKKAYNRLKELEIFSDDFETFKNFFYDNLKEDRKDEAIELLLMVIFKLLKSQGERFNILLENTNNTTKDNLIKWLDESLKKANNDK
ncbi:hypothetical protein ACOL22_01660 [Aliarcobacter butzleri]